MGRSQEVGEEMADLLDAQREREREEREMAAVGVVK